MIQTTMKIGFPVNDALDLYGRIGGGYAWTNSELSAQTATDFIKDTGNKHGAVFVGALGPNTPSTVTGPPASNTSTPPRSGIPPSIVPASRWTTACWRLP